MHVKEVSKQVVNIDHDYDVRKLAARAVAARQALCRENFSEFARYVLRDEETGNPIHPGWIHRKWAKVLRTHKRVALLAQTELGKSQQLSVAYILWRIGRNPRLRCAIVSNAQAGASRLIRNIQTYILNSAEYHAIFPDVKRGEVWKADSFEIQRPGAFIKEPTAAAYGLDSKSIMGTRLDLVILDDVDNYTSTYTDTQRHKTEEFITTSVFSRLTSSAQVVVVGNAWHKEDLIHRLAKQGSYVVYTCPAIITQKVLDQWPDCPYKLGDPLWPDWWPVERLKEKKANSSAREWNRGMMCIPMSDDMSLFTEHDFVVARKRGDGLHVINSIQQLLEEAGFTPNEAAAEIHLMQAAALTRGYVPPEDALEEELPAFRIIHGVDMSTGRSNDKTAIVTICAYDDGTRRILSVQEGHFQGAEIFHRMQETYVRFGGLFVVESIGMQRQIFDLMRDGTTLPVLPFPTSLKDKTIGFSTISAEFSGRKWVVPSTHGRAADIIEELLSGLYDFNPSSHTRDSAMALLFAVGLLRGIEAYEAGSANTVNVSFTS